MRISILTPSYGYGAFIESCVTSVLGQSHPDLEHIVVDGGSNDDTVPNLTRLAAADDRVRWISEPDRGPSDALNKAIRLATGDWVGWLNVDEVYLPGALDLVAHTIERSRDPGLGLLHGDFYEMTAEGECMRLVAQHGWSRRSLRRGCYIPTCATFLRRDVLAEGEPWDVELPSMMDWDLFLRLTGRGVGVRHVRRPIAAFRVHPLQITASHLAQTDDEFRLIRGRHGLPLEGVALRRVRVEGRAAHVARKSCNGGYLRELRAARTRASRNLFESGSAQVAPEWRVGS